MNNNENNLNQNVTPNIQSNPINTTPVAPSIPVQTTPITPSVPVQTNNNTIQASVVEEITNNNEDMSDVADITFDYNQIYGVQNNEQKEEKLDVVDKPMFTEQELDIKVNDIQNRTSNDVVPEFNINALNDNVSKEESKLTDNVLSDKQQEKQETRRAIIWIVVLVLLLIISVGFIFPIIAGYK